jgi:hypothetical protein
MIVSRIADANSCVCIHPPKKNNKFCTARTYPTYILYTQICLDAPHARSTSRNDERSSDAKRFE